MGLKRYIMIIGLCLVATVAAGGPPERTHVQVEGGDHFICSTGVELDGRYWVNDTYVTELQGFILTVDGSSSGHGELVSSTGRSYKDRVAGSYHYVIDLSTTPETLLEYSQTGNLEHLFVPGEGTIYHDTGMLRIIVNPLTGEVSIDEAGQHDLFHNGLDTCGWFDEGNVVDRWSTPSTVTVRGPRH